MSKQLILIIFLFISGVASAQKDIYYGVYMSSSFTRYIDFSKNQYIPGDYGYKPSLGGGIIVNGRVSKKFRSEVLLGYQQRGSLFSKNDAIPAPRYRTGYVDALFDITYQPFKPKIYIGRGFSFHSLVRSVRYDFVQKENVFSDFNWLDIGFFTKAGYIFPVKESQLRVELVLNAGLRNVYSGNLKDNGMNGRNFLAGLTVIYLPGRKPAP
jgi:hypothetical protein